MNHYNDGKFVRISKQLAKILYDAGETVAFCPRKLRPGGGWSPQCPVKKDSDTTFESVLNNFLYYNATYETGYYAAFYLEHTSQKEVKA